MKCIYCNAETELTLSDIITYAITGAKVAKTFVCQVHNAFTNKMYEIKFVDDLNFFRNQLGFSTREGKPIQYIADISVDGTKMHNVKISNREALYAPKSVVAGFDDDGNKVLMAPMEKLDGISKGKATVVDISDVILHKTITADCFLGFHALHSIAKIAYEWYCYINNIEEYPEECKEIVDYILGKAEGDFVDVIIERNYYYAIDRMSEVGTNALFQYDDIDGYRYVVFDLWKTVAYRVRICKSPNKDALYAKSLFFELYLYHVDGSKTKTAFGAVPIDENKKPTFYTIRPKDIGVALWRVFVERIEEIMSTMVLSIYTLKREVDLLASRLKKYDEGKIDVACLLGFEDNNVVTTVDVIGQIYLNKDKYDTSKSFNQNLRIILNSDSDTIAKTQEDKIELLKSLLGMDRERRLSEYLWNGVNLFYQIYENEMNLVQRKKYDNYL